MTASAQDREMIALEHAYWKAIQEADVKAAEALTDASCVVTGASGAALIDRKMFASMLQSDQWKVLRYSFLEEPVVHWVNPEVAILAYPVRQELRVEGKTLSFDAADTSTWVRRDGKWFCVSHTEALLGDPFGRDRAAKAKNA